MNYGHVVITLDRAWLRVILSVLHLIHHPWAQRLVYYNVARRIVSVDQSSGIITLDRPFPKCVKSGESYEVQKSVEGHDEKSD